LAEKEVWSFNHDEQFDILGKYIYGTFARCYSQNKMIYSEDRQFCCFNTGLLTENGKDIVMLFDKNQNPDCREWHLKGFYDQNGQGLYVRFSYTASAGLIHRRLYRFLLYPLLNIEINTDHIRMTTGTHP
jgi:hypothetical protein